MKKLSSLKQSAKLRESTHLRPETRNNTRWSSTFAMYHRFLHFLEFIDSAESELAERLPTATVSITIRTVMSQLKEFESVNKKLQEVTCDIADAKNLFDELLISYPELQSLLACNGRLKSPNFELALSKNINLEPLNNEQKSSSKVLAGEVVEQPMKCHNLWPIELFPKRTKNKSRIWKPKMDPPTSNIAENLFSKVKHEFTDYRKSLLPVNLESQIFLPVNCDFWSIHTFNFLV